MSDPLLTQAIENLAAVKAAIGEVVQGDGDPRCATILTTTLFRAISRVVFRVLKGGENEW